MAGSNLPLIVDDLLKIQTDHPLRVGIDGFCAAGKTTIADNLTELLTKTGVRAIRISTDDYQNPPEIRWQLGQESPEGFYRHAVDTIALIREVLEPLGPGGSLLYRTSVYDIMNLTPRISPQQKAQSTDVLLLDGLFLLGASIAGHLDYSIYVDASFETCIQRACQRNQEGRDNSEEVETLYRNRYVPGYKMYLAEVDPLTKATTTIRND